MRRRHSDKVRDIVRLLDEADESSIPKARRIWSSLFRQTKSQAKLRALLDAMTEHEKRHRKASGK